jgi:hypothetical protein
MSGIEVIIMIIALGFFVFFLYDRFISKKHRNTKLLDLMAVFIFILIWGEIISDILALFNFNFPEYFDELAKETALLYFFIHNWATRL